MLVDVGPPPGIEAQERASIHLADSTGNSNSKAGLSRLSSGDRKERSKTAVETWVFRVVWGHAARRGGAAATQDTGGLELKYWVLGTTTEAQRSEWVETLEKCVEDAREAS